MDCMHRTEASSASDNNKDILLVMGFNYTFSIDTVGVFVCHGEGTGNLSQL